MSSWSRDKAIGDEFAKTSAGDYAGYVLKVKLKGETRAIDLNKGWGEFWRTGDTKGTGSF